MVERKGCKMTSIMATYPDFQLLPREIKKLLLTSENYFFDEAKTPLARPARAQFFAGKQLVQNQGPVPVKQLPAFNTG